MKDDLRLQPIEITTATEATDSSMPVSCALAMMNPSLQLNQPESLTTIADKLTQLIILGPSAKTASLLATAATVFLVVLYRVCQRSF